MANCEQMLMKKESKPDQVLCNERIDAVKLKKDIVWLDYARLMGIFLVVFGHSLQRFQNWQDLYLIKDLWDYIYLFHMPLFFIISGYLYRKKKDKKIQSVCKLFYSLILPYLIYQVVYTPFFLVSHKADITSTVLWAKMIIGILDGDGYNTPISMSVCLPCWFIVSIIQIRILFMFIPINKPSAIVMSLFAVAFLYTRRKLGFDVYFCIDTTFMAIPYFLSGYYLKHKFDYIQKMDITWLSLFAILFGIIVYADLIINGAAQMNGPSYGNNVLLNYLAGFLGSMMIFIISILITKILKEKAFVKTISRNTLFIIFFHWVLLAFWSKAQQFVLPKEISSTSCILFAIFLSTCIILISNSIINTYVGKYPLLFGKKKIKKFV